MDILNPGGEGEWNNAFSSSGSIRQSTGSLNQHGQLPQLKTYIKNIYFAKGGSLICDIYVYKDDQLQKKLKKHYADLLDLEDFIRIKY